MNDIDFSEQEFLEQFLEMNDQDRKRILFILELQSLKRKYIEKDFPNHTAFFKEADKKISEVLELIR